MNKTQKGFALIESLLIILILTIIGFGGYYVWHTQKQTDKTNSDTLKASQSTTVPSSDNSPVAYLTIKEWGVRMKLSNETTSLYYAIKPDDPNVAYLGFRTIDKIAPSCAADQHSLALIFRQTPAQHDENVKSSNGLPADIGTTKIGDYYYGYEHSHAACDDGTIDQENAINKAQPNQDLQAIFDTLEAAQ